MLYVCSMNRACVCRFTLGRADADACSCGYVRMWMWARVDACEGMGMRACGCVWVGACMHVGGCVRVGACVWVRAPVRAWVGL